jgi:hypothetical protein
MAYTETTRVGYGKRLGNSLGGIGTGILLFLAGTVLLWWNEGRAVKTAKMLKEAQGQVVEMTDISKVDPEFEGKLIHASGFANTTDSLFDSRFNVGARAISIKRDVEYYQWVEHSTSETKDKVGGAQETTTTYTYDLQWVSSPISSADFHDPEYKGRNSVKEELDDQTLYAKNVSFGAYQLNASQISSISGEVPLAVNGGSNVVYIGENAAKPEVGDVRITFTQVLPAQVTVIAAVSGNTFVPFKAKSGKTFSALRMGDVPQEQIFENAKSTNKMALWGLRLLGLLLIFFGLKSMVSILETLFKVLPFLANIVGWGTSIVCGVVAFVWTLLICAIAWIVYRPVLAICLLLLAGAALWYFGSHKKQGAAAAPETPETPAE